MSHDALHIPQKQVVSSRVVYQNPWITVHEDATVGADGSEGIYGYIESKDSCMIVAVDENEKIYLVRSFRHPSRSYGWELPGGGGEGQDLLEASKRELEEETGILAKSWEILGEAYVCNGLLTEKMAVHLARDLSFDGTKEQSDEQFESMQFFSPEEIDDMIRGGEINDSQTIAGLHYYHLWKKENR